MNGKYFNGKMDGLTFLINMVIQEQNLPPNDKWEFETEDDFLKALRFFGYSDERARKSLQHERDHITKARELGYTPAVLGINIWNHPIFGRVVGPYARINGLDNAPEEDRIKILGGVEVLSVGDFCEIEELTGRQA